MGNTKTAKTNLQKAQELFTAQGNTAFDWEGNAIARLSIGDRH
jgi:hypothetical protein